MRGISCLALLALAFLAPLAFAQEGKGATPTQELVEKERVRSQVESILADLYAAVPRGEHEAPLFNHVTERLIPLGSAVTPYMLSELRARNRFTFNVAAYVLAFLKVPEARDALLLEAEAANRDGGEFGADRKAWVAYALAMLSDPDALDVLDSGDLNSTRRQFMVDTTILEVVAVLAAPQGTPRLLDKLDRYAADEKLSKRLPTVLTALQRVADPQSRARILPYLEHEEPYVRAGAARALVAPGDPSIADRLLEALRDKSPFVRFGVAAALEDLKPAGKTRPLLARLEVEDDSSTRGAIYRILASTGGEPMIEAFANNWGRPDPMDRFWLVDAVARLGSRKGLNLLRSALRDEDLRVVFRAMAGISEIGGAGASETLLALLQDPRGPVEQEAIHLLVTLGEKRAAPRIAERLLRDKLAAPMTNVEERDGIMLRGNALVHLRYTDALPELQKAIRVQPDPTLVEYLEGLVKRLTVLAERKDDPARWAEAAGSPDPVIRSLAYARLGELRVSRAAQALVDSFGRVSTEEGVEVLRALGRARAPEGAALLERVLIEPGFDAWETIPLRNMAAWAASQLGGEKMAAALKRSAERRQGQDVYVLVYLATLTGRDALPTLAAWRVPRIRYFHYTRGREMERLDWMIRELQAGRSVESLNRPPDEIAQ